MSYTKKEREQIAANILEYMQAPHVEAFTGCAITKGGKRGTLQAWKYTRPMTVHDMHRLELVARDVLGLVDHEQLPASINQGPPTPPHYWEP